MEDSFSMDGDGRRRDGSGSNASGSDGERWGAADAALLARPLLTSGCAALFLTDRGLLVVRGPGVGDPWSIPFF